MEGAQDGTTSKKFGVPSNNGAGQFASAQSTASIFPQNHHGDESQAALKFGLIRGYHRQMYASAPGGDPSELDVPCCNGRQTSRLTRAHPLERVNWGVAVGCILLILGALALLIGFLMPQKAYEELRRIGSVTRGEEKKLRELSTLVDILVIAGLTVLSIGGVVISVALLFPLLKRKKQHVYRHQDEPIDFFTSEVYVKEENNGSKKSRRNDKEGALALGFLKDFEPGDVVVRKIQPVGLGPSS